MKIIRYSIYGYKPQIQSHHMKQVKYHLDGGFNINDYPEFMRYTIFDIHNKHVAFYREHYSDLLSGIWCFVDGYKDNQSLNHLKQKVPCWEADIPSDTIVYDCNWEKQTVISDSYILFGGCYIPERELCKIENIKRRKTGDI